METILEQKQTLYSLTSKARESCGGSRMEASEATVIGNIQEAINLAVRVGTQSIIDKLNQALSIMKYAKNLGDRLKADDVLCDILNNDLGAW